MESIISVESLTPVEEARASLKKLEAKRQALEAERSAIVSELTSKGENGGPPMGIDTPLVDHEGYPRADIDVYRARTLRKRFHEIQNDQNALFLRLDEKLQQLHQLQPNAKNIAGSKHTSAAAEEERAELAARRAPKPKPRFDKATGKWVVTNWDGSVTGNEDVLSPSLIRPPASPPASETRSAPEQEVANLSLASPDENEQNIPFAKIDGVAYESPASAAGLQEGDLIVKFGNINHTNHKELTQLAVIVPKAASEQSSLEIVVQRGDPPTTHTLRITPKPWDGQGMLGCHIVPMQVA
jgi:26S proteasome non-ATPase regulatory subunit 9